MQPCLHDLDVSCCLSEVDALQNPFAQDQTLDHLLKLLVFIFQLFAAFLLLDHGMNRLDLGQSVPAFPILDTRWSIFPHWHILFVYLQQLFRYAWPLLSLTTPGPRLDAFAHVFQHLLVIFMLFSHILTCRRTSFELIGVLLLIRHHLTFARQNGCLCVFK